MTELPTEVASGRTYNFPLVNSSVAPGSTLMLIPISTAMNNNDDRNVRCRVSPTPADNIVKGAAQLVKFCH